MTRRMNYNDGEGLVYADLQKTGELADKYWIDRFSAALYYARQRDGASLASLRSLALPEFDDLIGNNGKGPWLLSGTGDRTIDLDGESFWIQSAADLGMSPTDDQPDHVVGEAPAFNATLDATTGSNWRRDIVQVKINVPAASDSESRDFKDGATGAITSQSMDKRVTSSMTMSVKKGVEQVSEALADANIPTPDSGYTRIASFLVEDDQTADPHKITLDHRSAFDLRHAEATETFGVSGLSVDPVGSAWTDYEFADGQCQVTGGSITAGKVHVPLDLPNHIRFRNVKVWIKQEATQAMSVRLMMLAMSSGSFQAASQVVQSGVGTAIEELEIPEIALARSWSGSTRYMVEFWTLKTGHEILGGTVTYDRSLGEIE